MLTEQNEPRSTVIALLTLLLSCQCAHASIDRQLYIKSSCQWSYQIKDIYNVTTQVCPETSAIPTFDHSLFPSEIYQLRITPVAGGREIEINWEYLGCYMEFYVKFEVSFQPYYLVDNSSRKCIHFTVKRLSNKSASDVRLHFNCLRINSKNVGTLSVQSYEKATTENICSPQSPVYSYKSFNLGCAFDKTKVEFGKCLAIEFRGLHPQTDFRNTSIKLHSPEGCIRTFRGTDIIRFNDPGILQLPVYENGNYSVDVKLVCNTFGEIYETTFHLHNSVTNAPACPAYNSRYPSSCSDSTTPRQTDASSPQTSQSTHPLLPSYNRLYTVITVVLGIGVVGLIVFLVFIRRRRQQGGSGQDIGTNQADGYPLQDLSRNSGHNNIRRDEFETTELYEEETLSDVLNDIK